MKTKLICLAVASLMVGCATRNNTPPPPLTSSVTADADCSWTATASAPWISLSSGSGDGSGAFTFSVAANTSASPRTGTITITLTQNGAAPAPVAGSWVKRFGGTAYDSGMALAVDNSGNTVAAGYFQGSASFGGSPLSSAGGYDMVIARHSPAGAHLWSQRFGGTGDEFVKGVAVDASGNIVVAGFFTGTANFGGGSLVSAGQRDIFIAQFSATGAHQWSKRFGSGANDSANDVAVDSSGNVLMTGFFANGVDFGGGTLWSAWSGNDTFLLKLSPSGAHLWSKNFVTDSDDFGQKVAVDSGGNVVIGGYFAQGSMDFGGGRFLSAGATDAYLAKFSPAGTHVWSKTFGSTAGDQISGVAVDAGGNVVILGYFSGTVNFGGANLTSGSTASLVLAKYSASGAHQWSKAFGGTGYKAPTDVIVDASGNVVITGGFTLSLNLGGGDMNAVAPNQAVFLAKYSPTGGFTWSKSGSGSGSASGASVGVDGGNGVVVVGNFVNSVNFEVGSVSSAGGLDMFLLRLAQ